MPSHKAKVEKNETRDIIENKGRGRKTVKCWIFGSSKIPSMGGQCGSSTKEGWKGSNVHRLSRFESC